MQILHLTSYDYHESKYSLFHVKQKPHHNVYGEVFVMILNLTNQCKMFIDFFG